MDVWACFLELFRHFFGELHGSHNRGVVQQLCGSCTGVVKELYWRFLGFVLSRRIVPHRSGRASPCQSTGMGLHLQICLTRGSNP